MKTKRYSRLYQFKPIRCPQDIQRIIDLLDGHMHLSDWTGMNDILEGVYKIEGDADNSGIQSVFQAKQGYGVACFCGSYRLDGSDVLKKHLMWSHYASSHTGVAIEFEAPKTEGDRWFISKMQYGDKMMTKTAAELNRNRYDGDNAARDKLAKELLTCKLKEWKYEKEWRLLVDKELLDGKGCWKVQVGERRGASFPLKIAKVYLGSRFERNPACLNGAESLISKEELRGLRGKCDDVGVPCSYVSAQFPDYFMTKEDYELLDRLQGNGIHGL